VLFGGRRQGWHEQLADELSAVRLRLCQVPLLEYDIRRRHAPADPGQLAREIRRALDQLGFAPEQTVLHIHNHALGKNVALPGAVGRLAEQGYALVLEPHDFPEDYRPANFQAFASLYGHSAPDSWHGWLYPQAPHIHYAVLNGRDAAALRRAGVDPDRLHLLPNPVLDVGTLPPKDEARRRLEQRFGVGRDQRFLLYPVRCIRRKNVGEAVLYGAVAPPETVVGMTLPAVNPAEAPIYERWKAFAAEHALPCRFELGAAGGLRFPENLAAADLALTTSVAEGFGMAFLESWLAGLALVGRDLPEITADFTCAGLRLDYLRPKLLVPLEWVGRDAFGHALLAAYHRTLASYGRSDHVSLEGVLQVKGTDGLVDFADLGEAQQERVIQRVVRSQADRRELLALNPWLLQQPAEEDGSQALIDHNQEVIGAHYALIPSGRRLAALYRQALDSPRHLPPRPLAQAARILDAFLDLNRFRLIRSTHSA